MPNGDDSLLNACLGVSAKATEDELLRFAAAIGVKRLTDYAWRVCRDAQETLRGPEIVHLIKLFTRLESLLDGEPRFCGCSTTPVPPLVHALEAIDADLARELAIWAYHTSNNPYVQSGTRRQRLSQSDTGSEYSQREGAYGIAARRRPARVELAGRSEGSGGVAGARAPTEGDSTREAEGRAMLEAIERTRRARVAEAVARQRQGEGDAAARALARAEAHKARLQDHRRTNDERSALLAELAHVTPAERLTRIALSEGHGVAEFPKEWADQSAAFGLPSNVLQILRVRLAHAPKGPWRDLAKALAQTPEKP
jgi:hypothetical protein